MILPAPHLKFTWLPLFAFLLFFTFVHSELCNPHDKKVLLRIKKAFHDPYLLISWKPEEDCCEWNSVECDENSHRIISISISGGELSGQIPPEVGDLPFLQTLQFHKLSNLTGPIQPAIAKLHNLKTLWISWTNISGPVPDFLGELTNLDLIILSFNNLTGTIPRSLGHLPNLGGLRLERNKLTGPIPDLFQYYHIDTPVLYLSHNQLSGKIPASFSKINFSLIDLSRNKLEGDASMLFGRNKAVWNVDLSRNLLAFNLSNVVFPPNLVRLDLNHNKIFGGIPKEMTKLEFQNLNVSYNRLCGKIPMGGRLQTFDLFSYFHNKCLCGAPLSKCK